MMPKHLPQTLYAPTVVRPTRTRASPVHSICMSEAIRLPGPCPSSTCSTTHLLSLERACNSTSLLHWHTPRSFPRNISCLHTSRFSHVIPPHRAPTWAMPPILLRPHLRAAAAAAAAQRNQLPGAHLFWKSHEQRVKRSETGRPARRSRAKLLLRPKRRARSSSMTTSDYCSSWMVVAFHGHSLSRLSSQKGTPARSDERKGKVSFRLLSDNTSRPQRRCAARRVEAWRTRTAWPIGSSPNPRSHVSTPPRQHHATAMRTLSAFAEGWHHVRMAAKYFHAPCRYLD